MNVDRLIARMRAALHEETNAVVLRALAEEYASLCAETVLRLESCLPLLRAGQKYAVLQIAETPPPLLDQIARLAFDEMDPWRELCAARHLPLPPLFDAALIAQVNALYGEQVDETHPLYRDYRAAMRLRDEVWALRVLSAILRVHPEDANAQSEALRIQPHVCALLRQRLESLLKEPSVDALQTLIAQREALNLPAGDDAALWRDAAETLRSLEGERARERAEAILQSLRPAYAARDERSALPLLAEWEGLRPDLPENFLESIGEEIAPMLAWANEMAQAQERDALDCEQQARARAFVAAVNEDILAERLDIEARLREWGAIEAERADRLGLPWPEEIASVAHAHIKTMERRRSLRRILFLTASAAGFLCLLVVGVTSLRAFFQWRETDTTFARLESLQEAGDLTGMGETLASADPVVRENRPDQWEVYAHWYRENLQPCAEREKEIAALSALKLDTIAASRTQYEAAAAHAQAVAKALDTLPAEPRARLNARLAELVRNWNAAYARREASAKDALEARLREAEGFSRASATLSPAQWGTFADDVKELGEVPVSDDALQARIRSVSETFNANRAAAQSRETAALAMQQARNFDAYFSALKQLADNPFIPPAQAQAMRRALDLPARYAAFQREVLGLKDPKLWDALQSGSLTATFCPPLTLASENLPLSRIFGDAVLPVLVKRTLVTYKNGAPEKSEVIYTTDKFEEEKNSWPGGDEIVQTVQAVDDTGAAKERTLRRVRFRGETGFTGPAILSSAPAPESLFLQRLRRYFDVRANTVRGPLLEGLGVIRADNTVSPLFKASVQQQWMRAMRTRPEVWGLSFVPEALKEQQELSYIVGDEPGLFDFVSADKRQRYGADLTAFYPAHKTPLYPLALQRFAAIENRMKAAPVYVGYWGPDNTAHLTAEAAGRTVWFLRPGQSAPRPLNRASPEAFEPYQPFFLLPPDMERQCQNAPATAPFSHGN